MTIKFHAVHVLTVLAGHEFDKVVSQTSHPSRGAAESHALCVAMPAAIATDPEWAASFHYEITTLDHIE